jgi:8-oxo-dGTP pyrophosphatase MutT (NUDIX family)
MRQLKACGVLIVRGEPIQDFLLMVHPTRLDLPKGHIEKSESEIECALRELEEETGISAADIDLDPHFRFATTYPVWPQKYGGEECEKTTVIFVGRLARDVDIQVTEHHGFQWRPWAPPHDIQPQTINPLLAQLAEHLEQQ